jgi:cell division protein ZapA (FtsZ GTPase activity inhibitor)
MSDEVYNEDNFEDEENSQYQRVIIFGESYRLFSTDGSSNQHLIEVAKQVDDTMRKIAETNPNFTRIQVAILTALNLADLLDKAQQNESELKERIIRITQEIEDVED